MFGFLNQVIVSSNPLFNPFREAYSGFQVRSSIAFELSAQSLFTSEFSGRILLIESITLISWFIISPIKLAIPCIEISKLLPRFITSPTPDLLFKAEINPLTVSEMKLKSRVGVYEPSLIRLFPLANCVIIVGITARADCRGP